MLTLAGYPGMMQRARKREGLRVCRAAWLVGVSVREYREIGSGDREPSLVLMNGSLRCAGGRSRSSTGEPTCQPLPSVLMIAL